MATLEELEETARLVVAVGHGCVVLSEAQLHDLKKTFNVEW